MPNHSKSDLHMLKSTHLNILIICILCGDVVILDCKYVQKETFDCKIKHFQPWNTSHDFLFIQ